MAAAISLVLAGSTGAFSVSRDYPAYAGPATSANAQMASAVIDRASISHFIESRAKRCQY